MCECKDYIQLQEQNEEQGKLLQSFAEKFEKMERKLAEQKAIHLELQKKLDDIMNRSSKNSSQPPSQDQKPNQEKQRSGGAKLGHQAHHRELHPADTIIKLISDRCPACEATEISVRGETVPKEFLEWTEKRIFCTHYIRTSYYCSGCRHRWSAPLPEEVSKSPFGAGLHSLIASLTSQFRLSKANTASLLSSILNTSLSKPELRPINTSSKTRFLPALHPLIFSYSTEYVKNSGVKL